MSLGDVEVIRQLGRLEVDRGVERGKGCHKLCLDFARISLLLLPKETCACCAGNARDLKDIERRTRQRKSVAMKF